MKSKPKAYGTSTYLALGSVAHLKRASRPGKTAGGLPYSLGALYQFLQNRLYIGQTNHKTQAYPGEHDAVIDVELWDAAQAQVRSNAQGQRSGSRSGVPSMFVGRVFTEEGVIPASDLEKRVLDRLRSFLAASGEVVQALGVATDAHEQNEIVMAAKEWVKVADSGPRSTQISDCLT